MAAKRIERNFMDAAFRVAVVLILSLIGYGFFWAVCALGAILAGV